MEYKNLIAVMYLKNGMAVTSRRFLCQGNQVVIPAVQNDAFTADIENLLNVFQLFDISGSIYGNFNNTAQFLNRI